MLWWPFDPRMEALTRDTAILQMWALEPSVNLDDQCISLRPVASALLYRRHLGKKQSTPSR